MCKHFPESLLNFNQSTLHKYYEERRVMIVDPDKIIDKTPQADFMEYTYIRVEKGRGIFLSLTSSSLFQSL